MEFQPDHALLADGRRLAFTTLGPSDGFPIVYLHGGVGTALTPSAELIDAARQLGIQWVALSRPGFGDSDRHPGRTMLTVAGDVQQLAAQRHWTRIAVVGVSTGGPYALACGAALPELVGAVAVAASLSSQCPPHAVPGLPLPTRTFMRWLIKAPRRSTQVLDLAARVLRRHERVVVRVAGPSRAPAVQALAAAVAPGVGGLVDDFLVCGRPWDFDPASIAVPVHIWHGLQDRIAPAEHAWQLAAALPNCRIAVDPDEAHFFFRRRSADVAAQLIAAVDQAVLAAASSSTSSSSSGT